ncbi:MerR family transcriptional regulator [Pseudonocardia humida]|uniref:MerR family transcriptional regulator n=1 Tax=Pseudonocardia humida TaxID=2800819 RepID=A0ABT0ZY13_9PSEU|nr:MerR family transcriptional regulator [Pseudonocardia humida]MCO1655633.1 MerR family transcriptional regulator [Pseudonocardia humida]
MTESGWTIDELAARVAAALGDGYPGAPNGRVRDLPNARAIRWYATKGLVDRPAAMRGRTALYGPRHLLQLVAVKRRQAQGRSLVQIQAELAGADEAALRAIAGSPDALPPPPPPAPVAAPARPARFWTERPAPAAPPPATPPAAGPPAPALLTGVPLEGGAVLLLPAAPDHDDLDAIAVAAGPLLDLLSARGLLRSAP